MPDGLVSAGVGALFHHNTCHGGPRCAGVQGHGMTMGGPLIVENGGGFGVLSLPLQGGAEGVVRMRHPYGTGGGGPCGCVAPAL